MATPAADEKAVVEDGAVREQDKFLPIANISRIMKEGLPQNAKISKDAKELVQQCVSDFIIFVTSECVPAAPSTNLKGAFELMLAYGRWLH